jgi:two-component system KDP operon response regulator KdpE
MGEGMMVEPDAHILVIDDAQSIQGFLDIVLRSQGYEVTLSASAEEALTIIRRDPVDIITLDLGLPDVDGMELLERIKQYQPDVPVIVVSVRTDSVTQRQAHNKGAVSCIAKPFEAHEVLDVIRHSLPQSQTT